MVISQDQWRIWSEDPVTLALRAQLKEWVEDRKTEWAAGGFLSEDPLASTIAQARALGNLEVCNTLLEWQPDELTQEKDNGKS